MRVCYTSDLHGRDTLYEQLADLLRREQPDVVILGGDMLPEGESHDPDGTQAEWVRQQIGPRIDAWRRAVPGLTVAFLMGNHDWLRSETAVRAEEDAGRLVLLKTRRVWQHMGVSFLGCPLSPPSPHWVKDYERLDLDGDELPKLSADDRATEEHGIAEVDAERHFRGRPSLAAELAAASVPNDPWIFVAHTPPWNTKLDWLPDIDYPIGSKAVRAFIESRRPLCGLHGHVHESPQVTGSFFDELAGVMCVNPGQGHERLHAVCFDADRLRETLWHTVLT